MTRAVPLRDSVPAAVRSSVVMRDAAAPEDTA